MVIGLASAGAKTIEQIRVGDDVISRDEETRIQAEKRVVQVFVTHPSELIHLAVKSDDGQEEEIVGTANHPFFVINHDEFLPLEQVSTGDRLWLSNSKRATVAGFKRSRAPPGERFTTYNFEVEDFQKKPSPQRDNTGRI